MRDLTHNIEDEFKPWKDLRARVREAGLTIRDLVAVFNEPPSTISARFNGHMRFPLELRNRLEVFLAKRGKGEVK